jgi:hypothetical protein
MKVRSVDIFRSHSYVLITVAILRFAQKSLTRNFHDSGL